MSIPKKSPAPQHLSEESPKAEAVPELAPGLYIVSTPIGNLRDITLRALDVLQAAEHILAEDTRQTRKLCEVYSISTPLSAYHDHNAAARVPDLIERLKAGARIALVSDAGTPLVSDPGFRLVRAAVEAGIDVWPVPGASALLAGLVKSGLPSDAFHFAGFLPPKSAARQAALSRLSNVHATLVFFETGPRIEKVLADIAKVLGERPCVLTRELTKRYEESRHGTAKELLTGVYEIPPKGELVLLIAPPEADSLWTKDQVTSALREQISDVGVKRASAAVAELSGWPKRDVYALALSLK
ncbi:16S rRNA (cytidine(1402)-2'-O)-methyltransferase [Litorimonas sp.]|uniref:16S rRNA (cytidine(1402)-2'-O)-methyltransferase n=1 Tax=Litorimonas sp. TaxID=1892381 RepID=UPI003A881EA0